jgi:hypothetical protein
MIVCGKSCRKAGQNGERNDENSSLIRFLQLMNIRHANEEAPRINFDGEECAKQALSVLSFTTTSSFILKR